MMIQKNQFLFTFLALIALFGIVNCVAIEPALAQINNHHTGFAEDDAGHCDFICHPSHHLWNVGSADTLISQPLPSLGSIIFINTENPDPPLKSFFHPPAVI